MATGGGDTALHWACSPEENAFEENADDMDPTSTKFQSRSLKVAEVLLGAGADVFAKNERELRPLDVAREDRVRVLLSNAMHALEQQDEQEVNIQDNKWF